MFEECISGSNSVGSQMLLPMEFSILRVLRSRQLYPQLRRMASATRALNSALCVRRTRLATLAFFFNFMVKTPLRRACARQFKIG